MQRALNKNTEGRIAAKADADPSKAESPAAMGDVR